MGDTSTTSVYVACRLGSVTVGQHCNLSGVCSAVEPLP